MTQVTGLLARWRGVAAVGWVAASMGGCIGADPANTLGLNGGGLDIRAVVIPDPATGCVLGPDTPQALQPGTLYTNAEASGGGPYVAFLKVTNPAPRGLVGDTSVTLRSAEIQRRYPDLPPSVELNLAADPDEYSVLYSQDQGSGLVLGAGESAVYGIEILSRDQVNALLKQSDVQERLVRGESITMLADVVLVGWAWSEVRSDPFRVKLKIQQEPSCFSTMLCPNATCNAGQDFPSFVCPELVIENGTFVERCP